MTRAMQRSLVVVLLAWACCAAPAQTKSPTRFVPATTFEKRTADYIKADNVEKKRAKEMMARAKSIDAAIAESLRSNPQDDRIAQAMYAGGVEVGMTVPQISIYCELRRQSESDTVEVSYAVPWNPHAVAWHQTVYYVVTIRREDGRVMLVERPRGG